MIEMSEIVKTIGLFSQSFAKWVSSKEYSAARCATVGLYLLLEFEVRQGCRFSFCELLIAKVMVCTIVAKEFLIVLQCMLDISVQVGLY